jgi:hypothetical protein
MPVRVTKGNTHVKKRVAIAGAIAAMLGGAGAFALAPSAQADPLVCIDVNINLNGTPVVQALCLPPEGAPGVPGAPALPPLPIPKGRRLFRTGAVHHRIPVLDSTSSLCSCRTALTLR